MATNRFERPVANTYNFAQYTPNFEAWDQLAGQIQGEYNQFETLAAKKPSYITNSVSDIQGYNEYLGNIDNIRGGLVDAFRQGGRKGRAALNAAQFEIMDMWTPGGLANQLESRLKTFTAESERIKEYYKDFGEVTPYSLAIQQAQINPLRNAAGDFQDVGTIALVNPYSTEDVTKWIKDHDSMIHETLLNNNLTRRFVSGNEFETAYDIILGAKGKDQEHIFRVLADSMPEDMKNWFQYKHNARSYNSGGSYDPGDQTTLYETKIVKDAAGNPMEQLIINGQSELAQTLWAVARGSAYIDPIRTKTEHTDWRAKKLMELNMENTLGFRAQGPAIVSQTGGVFAGSKSLSDVNDTVRALADNYDASIRTLVENVGLTDADGKIAVDHINSMVSAMRDGTMTEQEFRSALNGYGEVDGGDIDNIVAANNMYLRNKVIADYISEQAQGITGIDANELNNRRSTLASGRTITTGFGKLNAEDVIDGLASGKYEIDIEDANGNVLAYGSPTELNAYLKAFPTQGAKFMLRDVANNESAPVLGKGDSAFLEYLGLTEEYAKYQKDYNRLNTNFDIGNQLSGQYTEVPDVISNFRVTDPVTGEVNNVASQKYTDQVREFFLEKGGLTTYTVRSATDFNNLYNVSLLSELEGFPLDDKGRPDFSNVLVNFNAQPTAERGYSVSVSYFNTEKNRYETGTIPMPAELEENILTGGRGMANLTGEQKSRVMSDRMFNMQLASNNQTVHGLHIDPNKPLVVPIIHNNRVAGQFVYSTGAGTSSASNTDQGGGRTPRVQFRFMDENGVMRVADPNSKEAREAFYDIIN